MGLDSINDDRVRAYSELFEAEGPVYVTSSNVSDFTDLASACAETRPTARIDLLTDAETLSAVRRRFVTASHIADLLEAGTVRIRVQEERLPSYILTDSELVTVTGIDESILTTFRSSDSSFVTDTHAEVARLFEAGEPASLRAPAYSAMLQRLGEELGETMETDVRTLLDTALATRDDESAIEPVRLSILAGAKNEVQFYELSHWGEDSGMASRSTFSREKSRLENLGIVDTEKIKTGVGRPRQRLVLADDVPGSSPEDLLSLTESVVV